MEFGITAGYTKWDYERNGEARSLKLSQLWLI
jgi:hypothetical protein